MKQFKALIICLLALLVLVGCGNTYASVSNKKDVLVSFGNGKITKGELYEILVNYDGGDYIAKQAAIAVVNAEIETNDEVNTKSNEQLEELKKTYGDIQKTLDYLGYNDEAELMNDIVASVKAEMLFDKYFNENYDQLVEEYAPKKVQIIKITTETDEKETFEERAKLALAEIKAGEDFYKVAEKYCNKNNLTSAKETLITSKNTFDDKVSDFLKTVNGPTCSDVFKSKDEKSVYIVQVTVTNQEQLKDDFKTAFSAIDGVTSSVYAYYFQKHNLTFYDKTTFDIFSENYPEYISK